MIQRKFVAEAFNAIVLIGQILVYPLLVGYAVFRQLQKCCTRENARRRSAVKGHVALVTGSARGLGRDIAIALAKLDCQIAIVDIQHELAEETAKFIGENYGVKTKAYKVDVRDYQQLLALQESVTADLGDVTILVNNAGILTLSSVDNPPAHEVQRMINVNLAATIFTTQIFLPKMKELNYGYIVNISSLSAMYPYPVYNVYGATKAAVRHLTSSLRIDLLESKSAVRALGIFPIFLTTNKRVNEVLKALEIDSIFCDIDGELAAQYIVEGCCEVMRN